MAGTSYTIEPGDWQALRNLTSSFRFALQASPTAELEQFLPPMGERLRSGALVELIEIDLAFHWQRGRGPLLEDYLKRFPELGSTAALSAKLIFEEFRLRTQHGDRPTLDTYKRRFPDQFSALEKLADAEGAANMAATALTPNRAQLATPAPQAIAADVWATTPRPPVDTASADVPTGIAEGATLPFGGGYTLLTRLGSGTFGEVSRARSAGGGFETAIKIIFRSEDEDVEREVHALEVIRNLRHPFLLSTQSYWFVGKRLYIVMELAERSLRQLLRGGKDSKVPVPGIAPAQLLSYIHETAEALDFLHSKGVMHRDIKPENILLLEGHVKVADFGVVRLQEGRAETATVLGTPLYMPPEVWGGKVSIHSDQYSLALTYSELRLGRRAFTTSGLWQLMQAHCDGVPDLQGIPEPETQVLLRALAKDPDKRYASCCEFVNALDAAIAAQTAVPEPDKESKRPSGKRRAIYALLLFLVLFVVGGLIKAFVPFGPPDTLTLPDTVQTVHAGEKVTFPATLERAKRDVSVELKCTNLPNDIQVEPDPTVIPEGAIEVPITLKVSPRAEPRTLALTFESPSGASATVELDIQPLATLPAGCVRAPRAEVRTDVRKKSYYETVHYLLHDNTAIEFCLVEEEESKHPRTFYIMRDKVSNDLYRKSVAWQDGPTSTLPSIRAIGCLAAPGFTSALGSIVSFAATDFETSEWRLGGNVPNDPFFLLSTAGLMGSPFVHNPLLAFTPLVSGKYLVFPKLDIGAHDRLPVLRVSALEAHRFATWIGGRLPSINEWERAAGYGQSKRNGPFVGDWEILRNDPTANIGVGREHKGPLSLDEKTVDVSFFGCRHMSGNGKEWTNNLSDPPLKTVSEFAGRLHRDMRVYLRGRSYKAKYPVLFKKLDLDEMSAEPEGHAEIGFRVVLHPP